MLSPSSDWPKSIASDHGPPHEALFSTNRGALLQRKDQFEWTPTVHDGSVLDMLKLSPLDEETRFECRDLSEGGMG